MLYPKNCSTESYMTAQLTDRDLATLNALPEGTRQRIHTLIALAMDVDRSSEEYQIVQTMIQELLNAGKDDQPLNFDDHVRPEVRERVAEHYRDVGRSIRLWRVAKNWSQEDLAGRTGIAQSHLSRIEKGEHIPTRPTLERLAKAFNTSVDEIALPGDEFKRFFNPERTLGIVDGQHRSNAIGAVVASTSGHDFLKAIVSIRSSYEVHWPKIIEELVSDQREFADREQTRAALLTALSFHFFDSLVACLDNDASRATSLLLRVSETVAAVLDDQITSGVPTKWLVEWSLKGCIRDCLRSQLLYEISGASRGDFSDDIKQLLSLERCFSSTAIPRIKLSLRACIRSHRKGISLPINGSDILEIAGSIRRCVLNIPEQQADTIAYRAINSAESLCISLSRETCVAEDNEMRILPSYLIAEYALIALRHVIMFECEQWLYSCLKEDSADSVDSMALMV